MSTGSKPLNEPVAATVSTAATHTRWLQLGLGLLCMMSISSPQYVWTLMTKPLAAKLGVGLPELQITFSLIFILQTFSSPFQGRLIDRFGPRLMISVGTLTVGLSWVLASLAQSVMLLYLTYGVLGGLGMGSVYVGVVGLMMRWFPDRRAFAAGVAAAGYGMGAVVTTFPIAWSLQTRGIDSTLWIFGILFGVVGVAASLGLRMPPSHTCAAAVPRTVTSSARASLSPSQVLKTPIFWLMFAMMAMMSTSGLMVTSQLATFAADFGVTRVLVFGMAAVPLALTIDRFANGLTRPLFGWVSDRIGRENTMCMAFAFEGVAMALWLLTRENAVLFVLLSGVVFFGWGEIYSLFPSTLTDIFGTDHATENYGWLYISTSIGSIFGGPVAALLHQHTGSWMPVFGAAIALDLSTALLALWVLKPMRARFLMERR
jgi:OFA family oxalate/formate antiporter-like MFS transporter